MDDKAAKDLLKDTFGQAYDLDRFRTFVRELSKGYEDRGITLVIPDSFKDGIQSAFRVGKFVDEQKNEIDILVVKLQKEGSLDRARTLQRNFVAKHLSSPLRQKEAALVAFVSPESSSWRFSLVRRELGLTRNKMGKTKTRADYSPARRFSFWVGQGERTHTTQKQFLELLKNDARPNLKALEKAFDIETVTNAFFEEYRDLFNNLNDKIKEYLSQNPTIENHFKERDIETSDFAKRLLGQIVFLYFLQKKGWLGVAKGNKWGDGDKEFLQTIYKKCEKQGKNFFHDYLQPLFYSALNTDNSHVDHYNTTFECRIPYLNGGLFEPYHDYDWVNQEIKLPNTLFEEFGSTLLWEDGTGILNVFDRYNFTVAEDEPLEREVAIDPEMLGKVFEKLLPVKERGNSGTFYTPREIVHYMCQESLIGFLSSRFPNIDKGDLSDFVHDGDLYSEYDSEILRRQSEGINPTKSYSECVTPKSIRESAKQIDAALASVKVCDPAVGSGAFPVGMMMEIIRIRKVLGLFTNEPEKTNYDLKRQTIQESLYGVDLDAGAVEIAKLRLWLSLVVDEDNFDQIKALPNLDYKIMQGNSLLQTYEGIKLFDDTMLVEVDYVKKRREQLQAEVKLAGEQVIAEISNDVSATTKVKRRQLENAYLAKKKELSDFAIEEANMQSLSLFDDHSKTQRFSEALKAKHKEFFNETHPASKKKLKGEIDALEWDLIEASLKEAKKLDKIEDIKKLQRHNTRPYFLWRLQFNDVFSGENAGFDIVLGNPPYIKEYENRSAFSGLYDSPYYQGKMDLWYFFGAIGLDILKPNGTQCFIAPNNWVTNEGASKLRTKIITNSKIERFVDFGDYMVFETADIQTMVYLLQKNTEHPEYSFEFRRNNLKYLDTYQLTNFLASNKPNDDCALYSVSIDREKNKKGYLNFVEGTLDPILIKMQNAHKVSNLYDKEVAQGIVMPQDFFGKRHLDDYPDYLVGQGIFNLSQEEFDSVEWLPQERELIKPFYTSKELQKYSGSPENSLWVLYMGSDANREIHNFPNIKKHLDKFEKIITSDFAPYGLHRARNEKFFKGEKIVSLRKCLTPTFTYTDFDCYVSQTYFVIQTSRFDMKYLTGLLNSKAIKFWLRHKGKMQGSHYQVDKGPIITMPLPLSGNDAISKISSIVIEIFHARESNQDLKIQALQDQIDGVVYELYELTTDEIAIIENSVGS
jgi:adenine-specific DNA-methyltransferase